MPAGPTFPLTTFGRPFERCDRHAWRCLPAGRRRAESVATKVRPFEADSASLQRPRDLPERRRSRAYIPVVEEKRPLRSIPDHELLHRLAELMRQSRRVEADIVAHIAEVDERRLYAREALPSMFAYCTDVLHLSEAEAYLRIWAARASREHPMLLTMLADGRLHLTAIAKLVPHLTRENRAGLLERATHRSKRSDRGADRRDRAPAGRPRGGAQASREKDATHGWRRSEPRSDPRTPSRRSYRVRSSSIASRRPAPLPWPVQGAVHGQRRVPPEAGATPSPDVLPRTAAGMGSGRGHRAGRHREARTARGQSHRADEGSPQRPSGNEARTITLLAPHPRGRPACRA